MTCVPLQPTALSTSSPASPPVLLSQGLASPLPLPRHLPGSTTDKVKAMNNQSPQRKLEMSLFEELQSFLSETSDLSREIRVTVD